MDAGGQCSEIKGEVALPAAGGHSLHWPPASTACARPCLLASRSRSYLRDRTLAPRPGLCPGEQAHRRDVDEFPLHVRLPEVRRHEPGDVGAELVGHKTAAGPQDL